MDKQIVKKGIGKKSRLIAIGTIVLISMTAYLVYSATSKKRLKIDREHLQVNEVTYGPFIEYIPLNGIVQPIKTIYIETIEGGKVEAIYVEDGKDIAEGTPIIKLSNQQFQMDMINREAQLMDQQNNLRNARLQLDQQTSSLKAEALQVDFDLAEAMRTHSINERLYADSAIARLDYDRGLDRMKYLKKSKALILDKLAMDSLYRLQQYNQLENSLFLIKENLSFLSKSIESLEVRAPINGVLSQIEVDLGETVATGARIAQVDDMTDLKVTTQIAEQYNSRVAQGQVASFYFNGKTYSMKISKVYPEIINGHFTVDLVFDGERPDNIRRGQTLQLKLALGNEFEAVQIPRGSFYQQTGGNWVFVFTGEMEAERRSIQLGKQNADFYEVVHGLKPGEQVITSGYEEFLNADIIVAKTN